MEVFVLMGDIGVLLGVYASEDEARTAQGVYTRDGDHYLVDYYIVRQTVGAPADSNRYRTYIA